MQSSSQTTAGSWSQTPSAAALSANAPAFVPGGASAVWAPNGYAQAQATSQQVPQQSTQPQQPTQAVPSTTGFRGTAHAPPPPAVAAPVLPGIGAPPLPKVAAPLRPAPGANDFQAFSPTATATGPSSARQAKHDKHMEHLDEVAALARGRVPPRRSGIVVDPRTVRPPPYAAPLQQTTTAQVGTSPHHASGDAPLASSRLK